MVVHGMGDMVAWESHDVSTKKKLKNGDKSRCRVPRTCTPRVGIPTGTVELFQSPSRAIRAYGEALCHLEMRTQQECTGPFPCRSRRPRAGAGYKERQGSRGTVRHSRPSVGA